MMNRPRCGDIECEREAIITQGSTFDRGHNKPPRLSGALHAVRQFLYGFFEYEFERQALEMRGEVESVFLLLTIGDMLGVPIVPPMYSFRILPHLVPQIESWKRRTVRERDLCDKEEFHLHGV